MSQYFDPAKCNYVTTGFPTGHLLTDPTVPDPLEAIQDCSTLEPPPLPPDAPCPDIQGGNGTFRFFLANTDTPSAEVHVDKDEDGCAFNIFPEIKAPCPSFTTSASAYLVPAGSPPEVTFSTEAHSAGPGDPCSFDLNLQIGIPLQACPTISGTGDVNLIPPGEDGSITVEAVATDSISIDGCNISFVVTANIPCTDVQFTDGIVTVGDSGDDPASGTITVTNLSEEPCAPNFRIDLDLLIPTIPPLVQPTITDLCINSDGEIQAAEVTYYSWPSGTIDTVLWRSQFGYCDENPCYYEPLEFGLHNTACDNSNNALTTTACVDDSHWTIGIGGAAAKAMAHAAYPSPPWMAPGRKSKWIAATCAGIEDSGVTQTFATTAVIPVTVDVSSPIALEFWLVMDNWVTEVRVNGVVIPIPGLTDAYPDANRCDLTGPMCKFVIVATMAHGTNTIEFDVNSTDFIGGFQPTWLALKLEWTGIGACGDITTTTSTTTTSTTTSTTSTTPAPTTTSTTPPPTTLPPTTTPAPTTTPEPTTLPPPTTTTTTTTTSTTSTTPPPTTTPTPTPPPPTTTSTTTTSSTTPEIVTGSRTGPKTLTYTEIFEILMAPNPTIHGDDSFPVNSDELMGIDFDMTIVNRLPEELTLFLRTHEGDEEEIVAIPPDNTVKLRIEGGTAYVLRAADSAVLGVIPPVMDNIHKVVA